MTGRQTSSSAVADAEFRYSVQHVAEQMSITPASALEYFSEENVRDIDRSTARIIKEHEAAQGTRPPVQLTTAQAGPVISAFTVAARIGVVNGDTDVAADLCEVITAIAMELRHEPSIEISTLLLRNGINWARLPTEKLADGTWAVPSGKTQPKSTRASPPNSSSTSTPPNDCSDSAAPAANVTSAVNY